jgi:O-antigen/teichoic acid export membrane protein
MDPISQEIPANKATSAELDASLVRGIAWVGAAKWSTQALTWVATLVIARVLSPADYGIFSMAVLYLGLLALVTEFGLGTAIITIRNLSTRQIAQLNTISVILGLAGFVLTCGAAFPLSRFFHSPELPAVLMVMALGFVISSFQSVPNALLQRDLRFKFISAVELAKSTLTAAIMVPLAFWGARYWTLVVGSLVGSLLATVLTLTRKRHGFALPDWSDLGHAIKYSWQVLVARIGWYSYSNADFLVAGRVLGPVVLGYYTLAWNLATMPIDKITTLVSSVTPGIYSAAQDDPSALRRYLLKPTEVLSLILFPVMAGLALVSRDAVLVLLGAKWQSAILPLQLLSIYACIRSIMPLFAQILLVTGDSRYVMWTNVTSALLFPIAFFVGSRWGAVGIAATWVLVYPINAIPLYKRAMKRLQLGNAEYFRALWPGLSGTIVMVFGVIALKIAFAKIQVPIASLSIQVAGGVVFYLATMFLFHRARVGILTRVVSMLRS